MFVPEIPRGTASPEAYAAAHRIGRMGRIIIQAFVPSELWPEAERRITLTALAELKQLGQGNPSSS